MRQQGGEKLTPTRDWLPWPGSIGTAEHVQKAYLGEWRREPLAAAVTIKKTVPLHCRAASTWGFVTAIVPE